MSYVMHATVSGPNGGGAHCTAEALLPEDLEDLAVRLGALTAQALMRTALPPESYFRNGAVKVVLTLTRAHEDGTAWTAADYAADGTGVAPAAA